MGALTKALKAPSSYGAKKTDLWERLMNRLTESMFERQIDEFIEWLDEHPLEYPAAWREPLEEIAAKRRDEIREDDIGLILREKFDF
jgi:hypothetical protein